MGHSEKKNAKKDKKADKVEEKAEEIVEVKAKKHKKEKKDKNQKKDKKDKEDKKESKAKKDKKRKRESDNESEPIESKPTAKKLAQAALSAAAPHETASGRWNDWTKASFGGDDAQKNKFLRLLGAKKAGNSSSTATEGPSHTQQHQSSAIDDNVNQKMNQDLEKQFQDGLKMRKQQYGGKRGGLGWS